ncbi:MAG: hypothetical protein WC325_07160 [Candidatus Bathyarchaeia archaeon]|jgi:hypothetical protein
MDSNKSQLSVNAVKVYEYLSKNKDVNKQDIIASTHLNEEQYGDVAAELVNHGLVKGKKGRTGGLALFSEVPTPERKNKNNVDSLSTQAKKLWDLIPQDGSFVTNLSVRYKLRPAGFSTEDFWKYRKELLDNNLIQIKRGRGGSVARSLELIEEKKIKPPKGVLVKDESKLYLELKKWLGKNRVADIQQDGGQAWIVVTGNPRKWKRNSGHWSRPDIVSVEVVTYEYLQHRDVVVTTYELKRYRPQMDNSWVFEAASHSKGAHYSYLVVETVEDRITDEPPTELSPDLHRFGIGFGWLYFKSDINEYEFNEVLEPDRHTPEPSDENDLLKLFASGLEKRDFTTFKNAIGKT